MMFLCSEAFTHDVKEHFDTPRLREVIDGKRHIQIPYHLENELQLLIRKKKEAVKESEIEDCVEKISRAKNLLAQFREQENIYLAKHGSMQAA